MKKCFTKCGKLLAGILLILGLSLGIRAVDAKAYVFNVSTEPVQAYTGVNGTGYGYYGQVLYCNVWDPERGNSLKSGNITVQKDGRTVSINMSSSGFSATNYCNWGTIPMVFYETGDYTYSISGDIVSYQNGSYVGIGTYTGEGKFHIYDVPPTISSQPAARSVKQGTSVSFSTSVSRGTNVKYQWYWNTDGSNSSGFKISGATSSTYTIPASSVTSSLNGRYYFCYLQNDGSSITTNAVKLTVYNPPTVNSPSSVTAQKGSSVSFSVSASGGNPSSYSYQWYYSSSSTGTGTKINGATSSTYRTTADVNGRYYYCTVSNGQYAVTSSRAKLTLQYTVSYNANGGSGAPSSQNKTHGVNLTLSSRTPSREGYSFQGWSTSSTVASVSYDAGDIYTGNGNMTLYAVWKANTYTIYYNANGGSGSPPSQTKTYGVSLRLSSQTPTRTGYTFQGWSTSSASTSVSYYAGAAYTVNAGATLYAVWKIDTYQVTYDANGGSGAPSAQVKTFGINLTLSSQVPNRPGYEFRGWSTGRGDVSVLYQPGGTYSDNGAVTLYAVWEEDRHSGEEGSGGSPAPGTDGNESVTPPSENVSDGSGNMSGGNGGAGSSGNTPGGNGGAGSSGNTPGGNGGAGSSGNTPGENGGAGSSGNTSEGNSGTSDSGNTSSGNSGTAGENGTDKGNTDNSGNRGNAATPAKQTISVKSKITKSYQKNKSFLLGAKAKGKLSYKSSNKKVVIVSTKGKVTIKGYGKAVVTITASATKAYKRAVKKVTVNIIPKKLNLTVKSPSKGVLRMRWTKDKTVSAYEIQFATSPKFRYKTMKRGTTISNTVITQDVRGLDSNRYYYVRVRGFKRVKGRRIYGTWSTVKKVRVK